MVSLVHGYYNNYYSHALPHTDSIKWLPGTLVTALYDYQPEEKDVRDI